MELEKVIGRHLSKIFVIFMITIGNKRPCEGVGVEDFALCLARRRRSGARIEGGGVKEITMTAVMMVTRVTKRMMERMKRLSCSVAISAGYRTQCIRNDWDVGDLPVAHSNRKIGGREEKRLINLQRTDGRIRSRTEVLDHLPRNETRGQLEFEQEQENLE